MATNNKKFVIKNGLAVGGASGIIDIVDSNGTWIGATGILHGATGPAGSNGATGPAGTNGASGPSGATGIIQNWTLKTTTYTAVNKDSIAADTTGGAFTITLPATPSAGHSVTIADSGHSFNTNNLTIARNGSTIETQSQDLVVDIANVIVSFIYDGSTWRVFSTVGTQGASGSAGSNGTNGATGSAGTNGATGVTGTNGATGAVGSNGTNGATGVQGVQGVQGATGLTGTNGATGAGVQGASGATGIQGPSGQSSSYYNYRADTTSQSGDPGSGHITWNNAALLSANTLLVSHLTSDSSPVDVDLFLGLINLNDILIIQEATDSSRFQKWQVTGTPVVHTNSYYEYPVTLLDSGGTALANNNDLILAIVSVPVDGATGSAGINGATGAQGIQGASGSAGTNGATGVTGSNGATGSAGTNGATGVQGVQGATGSAGANGTNGATGVAGTNGTGDAGATGVAGINGATGSAGTNGATGAAGSNGTNGATGPTGATGIIQNWSVKTTTYTAVNKDAIAADTTGGAFTITLPASPSAGHSVTIADSGHSFNTNNLTVARNGSTIELDVEDLIIDVKNIFVSLIYDGTTWKVFSTAGIIGASGATGSAGTNGATGSAGTNGATGVQGATGSAGTNGATGISGATGSAGTNGATGVQGASGSAGTNGATGAAGSNGTNGATGAAGATGIIGGVSTVGASGSYYPVLAGSTGPLSNAYLNTSYTFNPGTGVFSAPFVNATGTITGSNNYGAISYGTLSYSDVNLLASFTSSVNTYNQILLQNQSNGTQASTNFVVSNDLATNSTNYGEIGMNSSQFNGGSACAFHVANTVYVGSQSVDLAIGTYGTNNVHFIVNNSVVDSMTINANNSIQVNSPFRVTTGATGFTGATGAVGAPSAYFNNLYVNGTSITNSGASITDDTTTNVSYYPAMYSVTSGAPTTVYTSSSKIYFNPSTGTLNSTIYNSLSDENKKKNIKTINNALDTVNQLNGVEFDWRDTGIKSYGVIAQEIEKVLPHLVTMDDQGNKSVNYNGLFGFLINAIKEQQKQIDDLKGKN